MSDTRGQEAIDATMARDPQVLKRIFANDGCVVEPGCTLPALRWLFDHEPETRRRRVGFSLARIGFVFA